MKRRMEGGMNKKFFTNFNDLLISIQLPNGVEIKPMTVIFCAILWISFVWKFRSKPFYLSFLLAAAGVAAALLHYEVFWNVMYIFSQWTWYTPFIIADFVAFLLGEILVIKVLTNLYGAGFNHRLYAIISVAFAIGCLMLLLTGFYPLWFAYDIHLSSTNPHLLYPYNLLWFVSKAPILGWVKVIRGS